MDARIEHFLKSLEGKKLWFVGIGVTNTPTAAFFAGQKVDTTACDKRTREEIGEDACCALEAAGVKLRLGENYLNGLENCDILFRTPGMYYNLPLLQKFRWEGGVVTSELEVFLELCPCPVLAVTGSDGKTTTTTLISEMLKAQGYTVHLGGNIGKALLPDILTIKPEHRAVVELSSFQLISMRCAPAVSVVTNVTPNHLDVHGTMEEYVQTKQNIFAHQNAFSHTVLGMDNEISASFASGIRGEALGFSLEKPVYNGAYYDNTTDTVYTVDHGNSPLALMRGKDIRIPGLHNIANYLAAICAVKGQVDSGNMCKVAREFGGVEHRIEFVREVDGVRWYNDSIATSPTRAIAGLRAFGRKIIMLAGGYDKKIPFEPLAPEILKFVSHLILCGTTADKIEAAVTSHPAYHKGAPEIHQVKDIAEAVACAKETAQSGDIVSLSPACASFDSYPNFEARGRHFKDLVMQLD